MLDLNRQNETSGVGATVTAISNTISHENALPSKFKANILILLGTIIIEENFYSSELPSSTKKENFDTVIFFLPKNFTLIILGGVLFSKSDFFSNIKIGKIFTAFI